MNFQQLRYVREAVRRNFNLTDVANALFTTQPGVSRAIKELEDELGVEVFVRRGKRLLGLTEPGKALIDVVERVLMDAHNLRQIAEQFSKSEQGRLEIATTHTQARYALPKVIKQFKEAFPRVHLGLHQGTPQQIAEMVSEGRADIGIATESLDKFAELLTFPCYSWHHAFIVPAGHPLTRLPKLTLDAVAEFPIITYEESFTGRSHIDQAFGSAGLVPDVVLTAIDADVIKTYVELGLGIGIIASMAYDPSKDQGLRLLDASHLFEANTTRLAIRKGNFLRGYTQQFIRMFAPKISEDELKQALVSFAGEV
ncbi:MAG TPA: CysB family HTH-type transcriptional regulator [Burkholderiales bacterium]|nr:CysB family HTH-type transcriptional regulator [Burkholderiales bacterium]